uniref:Endonuclease G n=1 Tax=Bubo bubo TaxID=30461 RepID=A0A8C0I886_BUBBB
FNWEEKQDAVLDAGKDGPSLGGRGLLYLHPTVIQALRNFVALPVSQKAMRDTFYLSNIAPQNPHLNQNAWNNLEKYSRSLARNNKNVYVCTGPLYLPRMEADGKMYVKYQVIGKNNVAVPTHFFKVLILEKESGEIELRSYVMPNSPVDEKIPLERFLVPIESIERASGLLFVPNILKRTGNLKAITAGNKL